MPVTVFGFYAGNRNSADSTELQYASTSILPHKNETVVGGKTSLAPRTKKPTVLLNLLDTMRFACLVLVLVILAPTVVLAFSVTPPQLQARTRSGHSQHAHSSSSSFRRRLTALSQRTVSVEAVLTEERATALFAWVSRAFVGYNEYDNLMLAIAAIFGNLPEDSSPKILLKKAMELLPPEEETVGAPLSLADREMSSLGAMGAGQWLGHYRTRPHSLLTVTNFTSVDDWIRTLPRGVKRTLKRASDQNFTVITKPIRGSMPAPHSSLAHFRCVLEHEVRLLAKTPNGFFDALGAAVGRYVETTRMAGEIQEYRLGGKVVAFAHEVRKGKTIRGQWFYATDEAAKRYVWFHSVQELVKRAIDNPEVSVVDLGPSGSDAFTELKERYGFVSVDDWPAVADYFGPFWHCDAETEAGMGGRLVAMERSSLWFRRNIL